MTQKFAEAIRGSRERFGSARQVWTRPSPSGTEAIQLDPKRPEFRSVRGAGLLRNLRVRQSDRGLRPTPSVLIRDNVDAFETRAKVWYAMNELDKVIADCTRPSASTPGEHRRIGSAQGSLVAKGRIR